jgi:opacity protein-like surface antigen
MPTTESATSTQPGWTAGAGLEYALPSSPNLSIRAEYLHIDLDDLFYDKNHICGSLNCTAMDNDYDIVRIGLSYRFR